MKKLVTSLFAILLLVGVGNAKQATTQYERALINAAKEGNASQVRGLLEAGTDPNVTDEHGNTPLIYGAKESAAIVDMLLYAGADVNAKGENGITPLINSFAVTGPEANTIRTRLLKAKPDVNAVAYVSQGRLHPYAIGCGEHQIFYHFNKEPSGSDAPVFPGVRRVDRVEPCLQLHEQCQMHDLDGDPGVFPGRGRRRYCRRKASAASSPFSFVTDFLPFWKQVRVPERSSAPSPWRRTATCPSCRSSSRPSLS